MKRLNNEIIVNLYEFKLENIKLTPSIVMTFFNIQIQSLFGQCEHNVQLPGSSVSESNTNLSYLLFIAETTQNSMFLTGVEYL